MLTRARFRVTKNGKGAYRVEQSQKIPGDIDGGSQWVSCGGTFSTEAAARADMEERIARAEDLERETTWVPV